MMRPFRFFLLFILGTSLSSVSCVLAASTDIKSLLAELKVLASEQLSYDYEAKLINLDTKQILDHVQGKLYRSGVYYLDSNEVQINMRDERYTLSIDKSRRLAYVTSIRNLEKKMKARLPDKPFDMLNLDALAKANLIKISDRKDLTGNRTILISLKQSLISSVEIRTKASGDIEWVIIKQRIGQRQGNRIGKIIVMSHFSSTDQSNLIRTGRYLIHTKDGYRLKNPFASYKISTII